MALLFAAFAGCSGDGGSQKPPQQQHHIQEIFHFWLVYKMNNENRAPATADELKSWVLANKGAHAEMFGKMGIAGREESAFVSPRDGEPYVLRSVMIEGLSGGGIPDPTVAYEQKGVSGKRYVVFATGRAEEVDAEKLQAALDKAGIDKAGAK
ncbi:MAG: hypothetical protein L0Y71_18525 [Gemmataceae bacterium]|nr:hypothetical protein [Gemmataceae bacterium]